MNYKELCAPVIQEMRSIYEDLHQHPELGFEEHRTAAFITSYLKELGLDVREGIANTGVVAFLHGNQPGKTVMLRADMDALPIQEETGLPYASKIPGVMHGCGHDGHVAMLLVAAKVLANLKTTFNGTVIFVFEPNEENAGAQMMIDSGVFQGYTIDACFASHLWSPLPSGTVGLSPGGVMGGLEQFTLTIHGRGGHTGTPHLSRDPILAAADIIQTAQAIQTRQINPLTPTVIMFGRIQAGTVCNAVPAKAELEGTIRFLYKNSPNGLEKPVERFSHMVQHVCALHDVTYDLEYFTSNSTVYNDPELLAKIRPSIEEAVGSENIVEHRSIAGEDFSQFSSLAPSIFTFIGIGNEAKGTHYPHHHPQFAIDPSSLETGLRIHIANALCVLK